MIILVLLGLFVALFVVLPVIGMAAWAIISAAVVGIVIGALGRLVVPGRQSIGLLATALLGLIGSIVGSFVGTHVLGIGGFSVLLEVGIAAAAVAVYSSRRRLPGASGVSRSNRSAGR